MRGRMYRSMPRLRASGSSILNYLAASHLRRKTMNSFSAVHDAYSSTKGLFERHKVVFTVSTSIASVLTAWAGYSLRQIHQSRVEQKLEAIEKAVWFGMARRSMVRQPNALKAADETGEVQKVAIEDIQKADAKTEKSRTSAEHR